MTRKEGGDPKDKNLPSKDKDREDRNKFLRRWAERAKDATCNEMTPISEADPSRSGFPGCENRPEIKHGAPTAVLQRKPQGETRTGPLGDLQSEPQNLHRHAPTNNQRAVHRLLHSKVSLSSGTGMTVRRNKVHTTATVFLRKNLHHQVCKISIQNFTTKHWSLLGKP